MVCQYQMKINLDWKKLNFKNTFKPESSSLTLHCAIVLCTFLHCFKKSERVVYYFGPMKRTCPLVIGCLFPEVLSKTTRILKICCRLHVLKYVSVLYASLCYSAQREVSINNHTAHSVHEDVCVCEVIRVNTV